MEERKPQVSNNGEMSEVGQYFHQLARRIMAAARPTFDELARAIPPQEVKGLGMWSDSDGSTLVTGIVPQSDIDDSRAEMPELETGDVLWDPGEWRRTSYDLDISLREPLIAITDDVARLKDRIRAGEVDYDLDTIPYLLYESAASAMGLLFEEGGFDAWDDAVQVFAVMDTDIASDSRKEWAGIMNTDDAYADFCAWVDQQ